MRVNCVLPSTAMMFWNMKCRPDRARRKPDDQLRDARCREAVAPCSWSSSFFQCVIEEVARRFMEGLCFHAAID